MKESNIIENDNENTNIADKQIQLLLEMENGINGWQRLARLSKSVIMDIL